MTKIQIYSKQRNVLVDVEEWVASKEAKTNAPYIVIVPDDGSRPFLFNTVKPQARPWKEAMAEADQYSESKIAGFTGWQLPTRKQFIDISKALRCGLVQVLEQLKAKELLKAFKENWFWTSEPYIPFGTPKEEWSSSRYSAGGAWYASGYGGYAVSGNMCSSYLALPVVLLDAA